MHIPESGILFVMTNPDRSISRRTAIKTLSATAAVAAALPLATRPAIAAQPSPASESKPMRHEHAPFTISLAQWSLHRALYAKQLDHLDFPKSAKNDYGIDAVEYVNAFWARKGDGAYDLELRKRCDDLGVKSVLIMCDGEGEMGHPDASQRAKAVENHRKWLDAAHVLGCHSIRVNAQSDKKLAPDEQLKLAADGLRKLCELANQYDLNVIVENHGGLSSDGQWLSGVMKRVEHCRIGTLPDFGNFYEYDRYQGVTDLMPWARGVSAKSHVFDEKTGEESQIDYRRMLKIVLDAGYRGRIGIEYEGDKHPEPDGIRFTKALLEKIRDEWMKPAK